jgi:hypothetical protein
MGSKKQVVAKPYFVGQSAILSGGYDMEPKWLQGKEYRLVQIVKEIPGQHQEPAIVVEFDEPLYLDGHAHRFAVLELRYEGAIWRSGKTCHIEVCDFMPEDKTWKDRKQGRWVESHATFALDKK